MRKTRKARIIPAAAFLRRSDNQTMEKVLRVTTRKELAAEGNADLRWWLARPAAERIAAVEILRQQHMGER